MSKIFIQTCVNSLSERKPIPRCGMFITTAPWSSEGYGESYGTLEIQTPVILEEPWEPQGAKRRTTTRESTMYNEGVFSFIFCCSWPSMLSKVLKLACVGSSWAQVRLKWANLSPTKDPRGHRIAKNDPSWLQERLKELQDEPKRDPREAWHGPKMAKCVPNSSKIVSNGSPESPKEQINE